MPLLTQWISVLASLITCCLDRRDTLDSYYWVEFHLKIIVVCYWTNFIQPFHRLFPHVGWLWPEYGPWPCGYCRISISTPYDNRFPVNLCMPLIYRIRKDMDSTELYAYLNEPSLNIDSPNIMTNPNYYDTHNYYHFQDMVSPIYEHRDSTIFYHLYNLNCKHRTRTLIIYNKCHASQLIITCKDEELKLLW